MGLLDNIIKGVKLGLKETAAEKELKKRFQPLDKKQIPAKIADEKAEFTARHEPWVGILRMDIDPNNMSDGAIELDWNDIFVARLVKAGYSGRDDKAIVDQWFQNICAGIVAGTYEQEQADPEKRRRVQRRVVDEDQTEIS